MCVSARIDVGGRRGVEWSHESPTLSIRCRHSRHCQKRHTSRILSSVRGWSVRSAVALQGPFSFAFLSSSCVVFIFAPLGNGVRLRRRGSGDVPDLVLERWTARAPSARGDGGREGVAGEGEGFWATKPRCRKAGRYGIIPRGIRC